MFATEILEGKISGFYCFYQPTQEKSNEDKSTSMSRNGSDAVGLCG